jgi:hypothetical protein
MARMAGGGALLKAGLKGSGLPVWGVTAACAASKACALAR